VASARRVIGITGASSGIGAAVAKVAVARGWCAVLGGRREERLHQLAREFGGPTRAVALRCDVTSFGDQERLIRGALDSFGRLDALVANAGVGLPHGFLASSPEAWREMVLTNVLGVAYTIRADCRPCGRAGGTSS
jgi:NADP-dependent 3-hydroxy acid dehydrogenase YdfG